MASTTSIISLNSRHSWRSWEKLPCLKTFAVCYPSLEVEQTKINDNGGVSTCFFV